MIFLKGLEGKDLLKENRVKKQQKEFYKNMVNIILMKLKGVHCLVN